MKEWNIVTFKNGEQKDHFWTSNDEATCEDVALWFDLKYNGSIVEFVVNEPTLIPNISNQWGNTGDVSTLGGIFEGEIAYIRMYFD